jgi:DNA polymerase-1
MVEYFYDKDFSTCGFDTETTSLDYYDLEMTGCSFSNGVDTCYIDFYKNPQREKMIDYLRDIFRVDIKSFAMHNAPFDLKVLHKEGITEVSPKIFCTMTAHHLINENSGHGLKDLAAKFLDVVPVTFDNASLNGMKTKEFYDYAMNDALWTFQLMRIFNTKLYELNVNRLFFEVEMPFQFTLMDMMINGVQVNLEELEELRIEASATKLKLQRELYDENNIGYSLQPDMFTGEVEFVSTVKLSNQTLNKLFTKHGLVTPYKTKTGAASYGAETLTHFEGHPFVDKLAQFNIVDKLLGSFIKKLPQHVSGDGRVRASFWNTGTVTGRLSCGDPNLQQLPKKKKKLPFDYKRIFEVPDGKVMVSVDYSGQELRILGVVAKCPVLIKAFKAGVDLHLMTANIVFDLGIPEEKMITTHPEYEALKEKYEYERHIGKNGYNFPIIYGTTSYGISKNCGISEEEAQKGIDKFFSAYPNVRTAIKRTSEYLHSNWHVRTLTNRRRRLNPEDKKSHRQAFNFLIQGLAADMIRCACNKVRKIGIDHQQWELKQIMIVHDEIVFEINEEYADEALPIIKEAMETAMNLPLRMPVDIGIARTYSGAK